MVSRKALAYASVFFVTGSLFGASVFAYIAPTADVERARVDALPGATNTTTIIPLPPLSPNAVDSGGVELDLDLNSTALVPSLP